MPTAFITGITGQDGSWLAELLLARGYAVHGLVRRSSAGVGARVAAVQDRLTLHAGDLADAASLHRALAAAGPDEIYHLGAQSDVGESFACPVATSDITGLGTARLLEAMRAVCPSARFYLAGSSEVFGNAPGPIDERVPHAPRSPYAAAKSYAVQLTRLYREAYGLHASVGLLFNHESERRGEAFVTRRVSLAVARIAAGQQSVLHLGNLDARRDWGYAPDYVEAMWRMLQQPAGGDYVVATGVSHSVRDLCERAFAVAGLDWEAHVRVDPARLRPAEVHDLRGDATRARAVLGWAPTVDFDGLVQRMVEHDLRAIRTATGGV